MLDCKKGEIERKAYIRVSKNGKKTIVLPSCIKDQGKPGKSPMPMPLKETKMKCHKGEIARASYEKQAYDRKAYYRKDNVHVKAAHIGKVNVGEACIKDLGNKGRGPNLIPKLEKGDLKKFGYSSKDKKEQREMALKKAVAAKDKNSVIRKLNAVSNLMKNTHPDISKKFHSDMLFVQKL